MHQLFHYVPYCAIHGKKLKGEKRKKKNKGKRRGLNFFLA